MISGQSMGLLDMCEEREIESVAKSYSKLVSYDSIWSHAFTIKVKEQVDLSTIWRWNNII